MTERNPATIRPLTEIEKAILAELAEEFFSSVGAATAETADSEDEANEH